MSEIEKILQENVQERIETFNGGELLFLFDANEAIRKDWRERITCAVCFTDRFLTSRGITIPAIPYRVYLGNSQKHIGSIVLKATHNRLELQPNAASAVVRGILFAFYGARKGVDIHEYIHILMENLQMEKAGEDYEQVYQLPLWYKEGLSHYVQGKKEGTDFFKLARKLEYIPPFILSDLNISTPKSWLEFGIMDQYLKDGNHPGLTACTSFIQFLIEKEQLGFKFVWDLMLTEGGMENFYRKISEACKMNIPGILNNYLYYIDQPFIEKGQTKWKMPVAVSRDFRGKFFLKEKEFKIFKPFIHA